MSRAFTHPTSFPEILTELRDSWIFGVPDYEESVAAVIEALRYRGLFVTPGCKESDVLCWLEERPRSWLTVCAARRKVFRDERPEMWMGSRDRQILGGEAGYSGPGWPRKLACDCELWLRYRWQEKGR